MCVGYMPRAIELLPHVQCARRRSARGGSSPALRILQLTDMHLWPAEDTEWEVRAKGGRVVDFARDGYDPGVGGRSRWSLRLIEHSQPDLVIFTGDIIDGRPFGEREYPGGDEEARSAWKSCFQAVTAPLQACDPPCHGRTVRAITTMTTLLGTERTCSQFLSSPDAPRRRRPRLILRLR